MARHSERSILRLGAISLAVLALVMAASFNLQKFPGFRGTGYHAEFTDANGLSRGDMVQIGGVRVGRVNSIDIASDHVRVNFDVHGAEFGTETKASVQVLNLLGTKYLEIVPAGSGQMPKGSTIPLSRHAHDLRRGEHAEPADHDHRAARHRSARHGAADAGRDDRRRRPRRCTRASPASPG